MADETGTAAGTSESTAGAGQTAPPSPWHNSANDVELIGHIQNKGWDKLSPTEAAVAAAKAHRSLEVHFGVPPERLLKLPEKPDDAAGWKAVHQRLGAPDKAEGYDFPDVALETPEATKAFKDAFAQASLENGLSKEAAGRIASSVFKTITEMGGRAAAESGAKLAAEQAALKADWGAHMEDNMFIARQAVKAFGLAPEVIEAIEKATGFNKTMNFFLEVGKKIGEDRFVLGARGNTPGNPNGVTTREGAVARKAQLMGDKAWQQRFFAGGAPEKEEFQHLTRLIVGA